MSKSRSKSFRRSNIEHLILLLVIALLPTPVFANGFKVANAHITEPVSWENPSLYFVIQNTDAKVRTIVGGSCKGCDWVEIHRTVFEDGAMTSKKLKEMAIPAGGSVAFVPRGLFLSLVGLTAVESSANFLIVLDFSDGEKLEIEATVDED